MDEPVDLYWILKELRIQHFRDDVITREHTKFNQNGDLVELDLSGLSIKSVPPSLLDGFEYLTWLDLSENLLSSIPKNFLNSCISLLHLDLSHNRLTSLPKEFFRRNKKLNYLNLSSNKLNHLEPSLLVNMNELRTCCLSNNPVNFSLLHLPSSLEVLEVSAGKVDQLDGRFLKGLPNLRLLDLSQNQIKRIEKSAFDELQNLRELNLGLNELRGIHEVHFEYMPRLNKLWLHGNSIDEKDLNNALFHLPNLEYLIVNDNLIRELDPEVFRKCPSLKLLSAMNNKIEVLREELLSVLPNLMELWLVGNPMDEADFYVGKQAMNKLKQSISESGIWKIKLKSLLQSLSVELPLLEILNRPGTILDRDITSLDLSNCAITSIPDQVFDEFGMLRFLNLSKNSIDEIPPNAFRKLGNLAELDLSENDIKELDSRLLEGLNLERLNLSGNPSLPKEWNTEFDDFDIVDFVEGLEVANKQLKAIRELPLKYASIEISLSHPHIAEIMIAGIESPKIDLGVFVAFPRLRLLKLTQGLIESVYISNQISVQNLDLRDNRIGSVILSKKYVPNLVEIYLDSNNLTDIPRVTTDKLSILSLADNQLKELGDGAFRETTGVQELNLSNNQITRIKRYTFAGLKLQEIDLSGNSLHHTGEEIIAELMNISKVDLSDTTHE